MRKIALLALGFWLFGCAQANVVQISSGLIEGTTSEDYETVAVFKGVPFAKPPIDEFRWAPPQPVESWEGVRPAIDFEAECMQTPVEEGLYTTAPASTDEDCLYLNVWTDTSNETENRPVMVWIHGGAFILGSGSSPPYNGASLASKGVVVVTINYRLGVFGFLAHPALTAESAHGASGNQGIYDQIAALQWVQDNISSFGGDPNNVTIFGESAGSISVCYLVATPLANGLFQRAIGQSGGCLAEHRSLDSDISDVEPFAMPGTPAVSGSGHEIGMAVAKALGVAGTDAEALATLRDINELRILETLREADVVPHWRSIFVDGHMFPEQMRTLIENGQGSNVDLIVGSTRDEGTALFPVFEQMELDAWQQQLIDNLGDESGQAVISQYVTDAEKSTVRTSQEILADMIFAWEMRTWSRINTQLGKNTFLYVFNHAPNLPEYGEALGAFHGAEISYIFDTGPLMFAAETESAEDEDEEASIENEFWRAEDKKVADLMSQYWINFATTGDPNGEGLPAWPAYDSATDQALEITEDPEPISAYRSSKLDVWDNIMSFADKTSEDEPESADAEDS